MNAHSNTTAPDKVPDFPILYPMQGPQDDLAHAATLFRILHEIMEDGVVHGFGCDSVRDICDLLSDARAILPPIIRYLDGLESHQPAYRNARRQHILEEFAKGTAA